MPILALRPQTTKRVKTVSQRQFRNHDYDLSTFRKFGAQISTCIKTCINPPFLKSLSSLKGAGGSEAMEMMRHNVESLELTLQFSVYTFFIRIFGQFKNYGKTSWTINALLVKIRHKLLLISFGKLTRGKWGKLPHFSKILYCRSISLFLWWHLTFYLFYNPDPSINQVRVISPPKKYPRTLHSAGTCYGR